MNLSLPVLSMGVLIFPILSFARQDKIISFSVLLKTQHMWETALDCSILAIDSNYACGEILLP